MSKKIYYHEGYSYSVVINDEVVEQMLNFCRAKIPFETGGILIGRYSEEGWAAFVNIVTGPPTDSEHMNSRFYRGTHKLKELLSDKWNEGQYYLGEWHFHPNNSPIPSMVDINQMKRISIDKNYNCPEPILLVIGGDPNALWQSSCTIFINNNLRISLKEDG